MGNILISSSQAKSLGGMLTEQSYDVTTCITARQAMGHLQTETPSLIILDADLPDISGTDVCYRIKKVSRLKNVPVILLVSAHKDGQHVAAQMSKPDQIVLEGQEHTLRNIIPQLMHQRDLQAA